jgi:Integrase core domain
MTSHGIRDKPIAAGSPWQNSFAKRLIGTIRCECVDHIVVLGEAHLRRTLREYARYYNTMRTHGSLDQDAPISRLVQPLGRIVSQALVGGLHTNTSDLGFRHAQAARLQNRPHYRLTDPRELDILFCAVPTCGGSDAFRSS